MIALALAACAAPRPIIGVLALPVDGLKFLLFGQFHPLALTHGMPFCLSGALAALFLAQH